MASVPRHDCLSRVRQLAKTCSPPSVSFSQAENSGRCDSYHLLRGGMRTAPRDSRNCIPPWGCSKPCRSIMQRRNDRRLHYTLHLVYCEALDRHQAGWVHLEKLLRSIAYGIRKIHLGKLFPVVWWETEVFLAFFWRILLVWFVRFVSL